MLLDEQRPTMSYGSRKSNHWSVNPEPNESRLSWLTEEEQEQIDWYENLPYDTEIEIIEQFHHNPGMAYEALNQLGPRRSNQETFDQLLQMVRDPFIRPVTVEEIRELKEEVFEGLDWEVIARNHVRSIDNCQALLDYIPHNEIWPDPWSREEQQKLLRLTNNLTKLDNLEYVANQLLGRSVGSVQRQIGSIKQKYNDRRRMVAPQSTLTETRARPSVLRKREVPPYPATNRFSSRDDEVLIQAALRPRDESFNWHAVADLFPNHTLDEVRDRFHEIMGFTSLNRYRQSFFHQ